MTDELKSNNIKRELKKIIAYEAMHAVKNKQRFSLRYYKKHPNKLNARRRKIVKALTYVRPKENIVGFELTK
ncbi:MAG: hypothetical protein J6W54_03455 [Fibrobacter sp.]|uniref:hypothetical protein n=1 Tax=Fibrobacter sp. TaxID=35828 RepID=UPI001B26C627|nr:hypothetical protein [Fibrobacter sp.]MBO7060140.1 hypothetical protein [Fibrobacter sp.]